MTTAKSQTSYDVRRPMAHCFVALVATLANLPAQAEVYKSVTPDGRVIYTDNPNTAYQASQTSQRLTLLNTLPNTLSKSVAAPKTVSTMGVSAAQPSANQSRIGASSHTSAESTHTNLAGGVPTMPKPADTNPANANPTARANKPSQRGDYQLSLKTPTQGAAYRRGVAIDIQLQLSPRLKAGDRLVYSLDHQYLATTQKTSLAIPTIELNPGSHIITIQVENGKGEVISVVSQTVTVLPNNGVLRRQRQAAAAAKAAYDQLPWYQKIKVNISR